MISQTAMMANPLVDLFTKVKAAVAGRKNFKNHNQKFRSGTKVFLHHHHQRYQLFSCSLKKIRNVVKKGQKLALTDKSKILVEKYSKAWRRNSI
jgi:hypothetical protein